MTSRILLAATAMIMILPATVPADTLVALHNAAADGISFTTASNHIGCACQVISDGVKYYAFNMSSGAQTVTVISA